MPLKSGRGCLLSDVEGMPAQSALWLKAIPASFGVVALISIPSAIFLALGSAMIFDAPRSDQNPLNWIMIALFVTKPLMLVATVILAIQTSLSFSRRRLITLVVVPAAWWVSYWVMQILYMSGCGGRTVCS